MINIWWNFIPSYMYHKQYFFQKVLMLSVDSWRHIFFVKGIINFTIVLSFPVTKPNTYLTSTYYDIWCYKISLNITHMVLLSARWKWYIFELIYFIKYHSSSSVLIDIWWNDVSSNIYHFLQWWIFDEKKYLPLM